MPSLRPTRCAAQGEEIFMQQACAGCHTVQGTEALGQLGPNLTHLASRTTFAGAMFDRTDENLRNGCRMHLR